MSGKESNTRSRSISSQRSEFDSPTEPEHEETGLICSGSQNVPLSTWVTFDASKCMDEETQAEEGVKKEKVKKSFHQKFRKGIKKAIGKKRSDHGGKKEEKISDEYEEEELSEATPSEHEEVQSYGNLEKTKNELGSLMQVGPDISMHSSTPSSLIKGKKFPGDMKRNEEVSVLHWKSEEEVLDLTYDSPHTSLTEVVGSVTVSSRLIKFDFSG